MTDSRTQRRARLSSLPEVSVRSGDPEEARSVGGRVYYPHGVQVLGDRSRFAMSLEAASLGPLTVGWLAYETAVRIETGDLGQYQVNIPTAGTLFTTSGNREVVASPRVAAIYRVDERTTIEGWVTTAPMLALKIDRKALEHELEQLLERPLNAPIDFALAMDVAAGRGAQWWAMVRSLATDLSSPDSLIRQPLVAAPFTRSVMTGLLAAAAHGYRDELASPAPAVNDETVRRAREFIEANADKPLTVADIARGAGVGVRGLQHGFQRSLDMSPTQFLRQVRLRHVHRELLSADPSTTVAEAAARWGFLHQGRFAAQYRERYGVQPGDTLRRRP
jgi:AraC-like DNA-binding protein